LNEDGNMCDDGDQVGETSGGWRRAGKRG